MVKAPVPDLMSGDIYDFQAKELAGMGIKLLLLDLDNTLVPYGTETAPVRLLNWVDSLKKAGIEPFILSNNHGGRPRLFAELLSIEYVDRAGKPSAKNLLRVLSQKGISPENAAIIGDQIYTDVLAGKRAGILTIAVRPIKFSNPFLFLRFGLEYPFRAAGKRGSRKAADKTYF